MNFFLKYKTICQRLSQQNKKELPDFQKSDSSFFVIRWSYFRCCQNVAKRRFELSKTQYSFGFPAFLQSFPLDGCRGLSGYIIEYHGDILSAGCLDLLNRAVESFHGKVRSRNCGSGGHEIRCNNGADRNCVALSFTA